MACFTYAVFSIECFKNFDESMAVLFGDMKGSVVVCELSSLVFLVFAWLKASMSPAGKSANIYHIISINCWILAVIWILTFLLSLFSAMTMDIEGKIRGGAYLTKHIAIHTALMAFVLCVFGFILY
jgi:hypothetical protein